MTIKKLKRFFIASLATVSMVAVFQSCGGESSNNDEMVAELQKQLDSTMEKYEKLKSESAGFEGQMATRDSAINAQAAEIQRLINQLNAQKRQSSGSSAQVDNGKVERLQKELKEKENTIKKLQKEIEKQSGEIASGNVSDSKAARLQKKVDEQESQIAKLKNDLKATEKEIENLRNGAKNTESVRASYERQIADLNAQVESCKKQSSDYNKQIETLNGEVKSLREAASKSGDAAQNELAKSKQDLTKVTVLLSECQKNNAQLQKDLKDTEDKLSAAEKKAQQSQTTDKNNTDQLEALVEKCNNDKAKLQKDIDALNAQIAAFKGTESDNSKKMDALNAQIDSQRREIEKLKNDIKSKDAELAAVKKSAAEQKNSGKTGKGNVSEKIAELQAMCSSYEEEIARLKAENSQLKSENAELKDKVASSSELFAENERLQQKVKLASVLVTSDLKVAPGKSVKVGNVVKSTTKASQTKVVRIDCKVLDNNVIDPGTVCIYARIANAANRVICNGNPDNYSFDMNGVTMQYTTKQEIEFTGYGRNITMMWKKSDSVELTPGLYWVTLYANGYEIGKVSFKLD